MRHLPNCDQIARDQFTTAANYIADYNVQYRLCQLRGDDKGAKVAIQNMAFWQNQLDALAKNAAETLQTQYGR